MGESLLAYNPSPAGGGGGGATNATIVGPLPLPVAGPLTDTQLRAAAVPVTVGNFPSTQPVSGPLTNTQLRASAVPVSGPLTDAELRASAIPVTVGSAVLPTGAATEATQAAINTKTPALIGGRVPVDGSATTQPTSLTAVSATGTIAGINQSVVLAVGGSGGVAFDIRGAYSGTVSFQGSVDGINFVSLQVTLFGSTGNVNSITTTTLQGAWVGGTSGAVAVRAIFTSYTSGSPTVTIRGIAAVPWTYIAPVGSAINVNIGTGSIVAGTNLIGDVGLQARANPTGAALGSHLISAATTNATIVKSSGGRVLGWSYANTTALWVFVKLHNQGTLPIAGSGVVRAIAIPPNGTNIFSIPAGIAFTAGVGLTTTTGAADSDATAVTANAIVGDIYYA